MLTQWAERAEAAAGLPPLGDVAEPADADGRRPWSTGRRPADPAVLARVRRPGGRGAGPGRRPGRAQREPAVGAVGRPLRRPDRVPSGGVPRRVRTVTDVPVESAAPPAAPPATVDAAGVAADLRQRPSAWVRLPATPAVVHAYADDPMDATAHAAHVPPAGPAGLPSAHADARSGNPRLPTDRWTARGAADERRPPPHDRQPAGARSGDGPGRAYRDGLRVRAAVRLRGGDRALLVLRPAGRAAGAGRRRRRPVPVPDVPGGRRVGRSVRRYLTGGAQPVLRRPGREANAMRVICPACGCNLEPLPGAALGRGRVAPSAASGSTCGSTRPVPGRNARAGPRRAVAGTAARAAGRARSWVATGGRGGRGGGRWSPAGIAVVAVRTRPAGVVPPPVPAVEPWDHAHLGELQCRRWTRPTPWHCPARPAGGVRRLRPAAGDWRPSTARSDPAAAAWGSWPPPARAQDQRARVPWSPRRPPRRRRHRRPCRRRPSWRRRRRRSAAATTPAAGRGRCPAAVRGRAGGRPELSPADAARRAADAAPPVAQPPPPPRLHTYTLPDAVTDAQIGEAIDRGVVYLRGRFQNGEVVTGPERRDVGSGAPPPEPAAAPADEPGHWEAGAAWAGSRRAARAPGVRRPVSPGAAGGASGGGWATGLRTPGVDALCVYALLHAASATSQAGAGRGRPVRRSRSSTGSRRTRCTTRTTAACGRRPWPCTPGRRTWPRWRTTSAGSCRPTGRGRTRT